MKVYLIRHGETTGDVEDRYGGTYDDHMTERGKNSARVLAEKLVNKNIEELFSSPYFRAKETAEIIGQRINLTPEIVDDIRERNSYGILSGLTKTEAKKKFPQEVLDVKDIHKTVHDAENYSDFAKRFENALNNLAETDYETIAIVTHGGPIKMVFRGILELGEMEVEDCAFAVLERDGEKWKLIDRSGISEKELD